MIFAFLFTTIITSTNNPTYTTDIKPIFETKCIQCHSPSWVDKNWMDYGIAFKNKDKIKIRVQNETMPPGNITELTKNERELIIKWVDQGAKK